MRGPAVNAAHRLVLILAHGGPSKREQGFCCPDRAHREPHPPRTRPQGPARCRPRRALWRPDPSAERAGAPQPRQVPRRFHVPAHRRRVRAFDVAICDIKPGPRRPAQTAPGSLPSTARSWPVLNSARAVEVSLYVVRAFVRLRETLAAHKDLASKLHVLEKKTEALALRHDSF